MFALIQLYLVLPMGIWAVEMKLFYYKNHTKQFRDTTYIPTLPQH